MWCSKDNMEYNSFCYVPRLSLNKMSTVVGWFLVKCPTKFKCIPTVIQFCSCSPRTKYNSTFLPYDFLRGSLIYNKALYVWSLWKLVSFVFSRVFMFPSNLSLETSGLLGNKLTVSLGTIHKFTMLLYKWLTKSDHHKAGVQLIHYQYDYKQNLTTKTPTTNWSKL